MTPEHDMIATRIGTSVAIQFNQLLPGIQQHLAQGGQASGMLARILIRPGYMQGEGPLVADIEFASVSGPSERVNLAPSPQTGQLSLMPEEQAVVQPVTEYPSAQMKLPPPDLVQRPFGAVPTPREQSPPPPDWVQPVVQPGLSGPIPQQQQQVPQQQGQFSPEQIAQLQQMGLIPQQQPAPAQQPQQQQPRPGRIQRPPMAGDAGIQTNMAPR